MIIEHERYKSIPGGDKKFFFINSDELIEDLEWITYNKIDSIRLTPDEYKLESLEPVLSLKHIKSLAIFLKGVDLGRLYELQELEELSIGDLNKNIDLSGLKKLQDLYLLYHKNMRGLNTLTALKKLIVVKADTTFFSDETFASWGKLEELSLLSPGLPSNLSFLKSLGNLKELEIFSSRSKFSASDLTVIKESLEILKIGRCKNIEGLEATLPKLVNLEWFALTDSITLKNTKFVNSLPKLQTLIVLGSSYFEDGDLMNLKGKVDHVSIDDKSHYNLKYKDFSN